MATDADEIGVRHLRAKEYDAVLVGIRLPPGIDPEWRKLHQQTGFDRVHAQLGLKLLRWLLTKDNSIHPTEPPEWIKPHRIAVFTVESKGEIQQHLDELGIAVFRQKSAGLRDTILLELIDEILMQATTIPGTDQDFRSFASFGSLFSAARF